MPASEALRAHFDRDERRTLQATGGDDYELCFTAPASSHDAVARIAHDTSVQIVRIGRIVAGGGVHAFDADGQPWQAPRGGHEHFAD